MQRTMIIIRLEPIAMALYTTYSIVPESPQLGVEIVRSLRSVVFVEAHAEENDICSAKQSRGMVKDKTQHTIL